MVSFLSRLPGTSSSSSPHSSSDFHSPIGASLSVVDLRIGVYPFPHFSFPDPHFSSVLSNCNSPLGSYLSSCPLRVTQTLLVIVSLFPSKILFGYSIVWPVSLLPSFVSFFCPSIFLMKPSSSFSSSSVACLREVIVSATYGTAFHVVEGTTTGINVYYNASTLINSRLFVMLNKGWSSKRA